MRRVKIKEVRRPITPADFQLTAKEIQDFLHNAVLATLEYVDDDKIPAMHLYQEELVQILQESIFNPLQLAAILTSTAYQLLYRPTRPIDPIRERTISEDPTARY